MTDYKAIVAAALKGGMAKFNPQPPLPKGNAKRAKNLPVKVAKVRKPHQSIPWRAARKAKGLNTVTGLPLVRRKHPELAGLPRKKYLRMFGRKRRKELKRKESE